MGFVHRVRIRYGECDMQGVVFNANWMAYFDDASSEFFKALGFPPKETFATVFDVMVVKAVLEWTGPAGFDDEVDVAVTAPRLGRSSFDLCYDAAVGERPVCTGLVTYVSVTPGENTSRPIPDDVRRRLEEAG